MKYHALGLGMGLLLGACTANNPLYVGDGDGGGLTFDGSMGRDGGMVTGADLANPSHPDLAGQCASGDRKCADATNAVSEACTNGHFEPDRVCPAQATCAGGYCTAPTADGSGQGEPCDQNGGPLESNCIDLDQNLSCQPFVDPADKSVSWTCATQVGSGLPGANCNSGKQCRTGFCGSNGTCYRSCLFDTDCPNNGTQLTCQNVDIVVEGVKVSAMSCIP